MVESNQTSCSYVCTVSYLGTKIVFGVALASLENMMGQTVPWLLMGLVLHIQGTESGTAEFMCLQGSKLMGAGPRLLSLAAFFVPFGLPVCHQPASPHLASGKAQAVSMPTSTLETGEAK